MYLINNNNDTFHNMTNNSSTFDASNDNTNDVIFKELQLTLLIIVLVTGAIFNTALILVFLTRRSSGAKYNLLLNLAVSNWIACAFILSRVIVSIVLAPRTGARAHVPCNVVLAIDELWWITQNWTLVAISFERFKKVSNPYASLETIYRRSYQFIALIWLLAVGAVLLLLFTPVVTHQYDVRISRCRKIYHVAYMFAYSIMSFWLPGFFLVYFYAYMMYKSYKVKRNQPRPFGTGSTLQRSWSAYSLVSLRDYINNLQTRRRLSRSESLPTTLDVIAVRSRLSSERDGSGSGSGSGSVAGRWSHSEGSDCSGKTSQRKKSLISSSFKPLISTLLIVVPYLAVCVTNVILIYLYSEPTFVPSPKTDLLHKTKYILVAYFPYVFGWREKEIKKELRKLYQRLKCWGSAEISPSPNIDISDYPENVFRRDSRRGSMISRRSSMLVSDEPLSLGATPSPYYGKENKLNSNSQRKKGSLTTSSRDPTQIFFISSPINMPAIDC